MRVNFCNFHSVLYYLCVLLNFREAAFSVFDAWLSKTHQITYYAAYSSVCAHYFAKDIFSKVENHRIYEMYWLDTGSESIQARKIKGRPFCITLLQKQKANVAFDKHQGNLIFSDYLRYWSSQFVCNGHFRSKWVWFTLFTAKYTLAND